MKDLIIPVNNEALSRALVAVAGETMTKTIVDAYKEIDSAMVFGYERGVAEAKVAKDAAYEEGRRQSNEDAWEAGYAKGFDDGEDVAGLSEAEEENVYNDGYVDGVSDARMWPSFADQRVAELCGSDEFYEGDSGDENDYGYFCG